MRTALLTSVDSASGCGISPASSNVTRCPLRASASAPVTPKMPAPTTATCMFPSVLVFELPARDRAIAAARRTEHGERLGRGVEGDVAGLDDHGRDALDLIADRARRDRDRARVE